MLRCLVCSIVFACITGGIVFAESVPEIVAKIETSLKDTCTRGQSPEGLGNTDLLVAAVLESKDTTEQAAGLQALSLLQRWETADQQAARNGIRALGDTNETMALLASRALETAVGGLRDAALIYRTNPEEYEQFLRGIAHEENGNKFYSALARITLAETLQDKVFAAHIDASLPLPAAATSDITKLREAMDLYREQRDFYVDLATTSDLYSRDFTLDFDYQIALLQFAVGDPTWTTSLQTIIDLEGPKDIYDLSTNPRHIFVYSFLRPPGRTRDVVVKASDTQETGCMNPPSEGSTIQQYTNDAVVEKFYNATQLALWTCARLSTPPTQFTTHDLARALSTFSNHDYRVVLGHYRGDKVRFSYATLPELLDYAKTMQASVSASFQPSSQLADTLIGTSCTAPDGLIGLKAIVEVRQNSDGKDRGYAYIGDGLTLQDAKQLLRAVQFDENFENAYLIRPKID